MRPGFGIYVVAVLAGVPRPRIVSEKAQRHRSLLQQLLFYESGGRRVVGIGLDLVWACGDDRRRWKKVRFLQYEILLVAVLVAKRPVVVGGVGRAA